MSTKANELPAVGTHGRYRFWSNTEFRTGTIARYTKRALSDDIDVEIERDGYRETAVMPAVDVLDGNLFIAD